MRQRPPSRPQDVRELVSSTEEFELPCHYVKRHNIAAQHPRDRPAAWASDRHEPEPSNSGRFRNGPPRPPDQQLPLRNCRRLLIEVPDTRGENPTVSTGQITTAATASGRQGVRHRTDYVILASRRFAAASKSTISSRFRW